MTTAIVLPWGAQMNTRTSNSSEEEEWAHFPYTEYMTQTNTTVTQTFKQITVP